MLDTLVKKRRFLISLWKQIIYWTSLEKEDALDLLWGKHDILDLFGKNIGDLAPPWEKEEILDLLGEKGLYTGPHWKKEKFHHILGNFPVGNTPRTDISCRLFLAATRIKISPGFGVLLQPSALRWSWSTIS